MLKTPGKRLPIKRCFRRETVPETPARMVGSSDYISTWLACPMKYLTLDRVADRLSVHWNRR